jgi:hypothetical protein
MGEKAKFQVFGNAKHSVCSDSPGPLGHAAMNKSKVSGS